MKNYEVLTLKSDNVYTVKASWSSNGQDGEQVDKFSSEKEAIEHAQWWTNRSDRKDEIDTVEVAHIIRYVVNL
tara:strand:+ start:188 stop:406 length:219 start_codon:yes stop_codon:yes gene_type:complete